jgi:hypothetical protein
MSKPKRPPMYAFLDALRRSGKCNMWDAGSHVERRFALSRQEAGKVVVAWMRDVKANGRFEDRTPEK